MQRLPSCSTCCWNFIGPSSMPCLFSALILFKSNKKNTQKVSIGVIFWKCSRLGNPAFGVILHLSGHIGSSFWELLEQKRETTVWIWCQNIKPGDKFGIIITVIIKILKLIRFNYLFIILFLHAYLIGVTKRNFVIQLIYTTTKLSKHYLLHFLSQQGKPLALVWLIDLVITQIINIIKL